MTESKHTIPLPPGHKEAEITAPPPPPPPPPDDPSAKVSPYVMKLKTVHPDNFFHTQRPSNLKDPPTGLYFFYGTLTDPSMVREILGLETKPEFRPAYITGFQCKLWGQYPALVDASDAVVEGAVYHVQTVDHGEKLAAYETNNYRTHPCRIHYTDGLEPKNEDGHAFVFQGNPKDLSEGVFDLRTWLKRMGRHAAVEKLDAKSAS